MIAAKIFNNNALATVTDEGQDAILIGLGIGFNKRPGDKVNQDKIEKIYYVQNDMQTKFLRMLIQMLWMHLKKLLALYLVMMASLAIKVYYL